ncbi:hypothetical protein B0H11DRAFT_1705305 [Mycena galericulata]|nr:hypothetical protein B0H11DRAFT_1705305 [Mycena galericulata]
MSRSRRSKSQASAVAEGVSILDKLILAQSVWEVGPSSWLKISRMLGKHPLLNHPKTFFTAQSCHAMYNHMMKESESSTCIPDSFSHRTAPTHLKLAEKYFVERLEELRTLIGAEEQQFKAIVAEIEQIRAGQRDEEIKARITGIPVPEKDTESLPTAEEPEGIESPAQPQQISSSTILSPQDVSVDVASAGLGIDVPEVEMAPEPQTHQEEDAAVPVDVIPSPSPQVMEDVEAKPASTEASPPPEAPSSPVENLDHLMQPSDEEISQKAQEEVEVEVPEQPIREEQPIEEEATPAMDETQPDEEVPLSAAIRRRESQFLAHLRDDFLLLCKAGKRKASFLGGVDSPRPGKRMREDSEPVDDDEQGSTSAVLRRRATGRTEEQVALKRFQTVITMVHNQISQHRNGNIFHNPIKTSEAPDYHDIVKRPIDLKTIKAKIKDGVIGNSLEYQRDIYLMFANAMMYNRPGSDVHVMAEDMMVESDTYINTFRQTEGYVRGSRI